MTYAKLEGGCLICAPKMMDVDDNHVYNPTAEQLIAAGYKPVNCADAPEAPEGYTCASGWEETEEAIRQIWTLVPAAATDADYARALGRLGVEV